MQFFVDSANFDELSEALVRGFPSGITTNPAIMAKEKKTCFKEHIRKIIDLIQVREAASILADSLSSPAVRPRAAMRN